MGEEDPPEMLRLFGSADPAERAEAMHDYTQVAAAAADWSRTRGDHYRLPMLRDWLYEQHGAGEPPAD